MRLHFAHANGFPPAAYRRLLAALAERYEVSSLPFRPLQPGADPAAVRDWQPFVDDLREWLIARGGRWIGVGHSLGAVATLGVALERPELFDAVVMIDPVLLPPMIEVIWGLAQRVGLAGYLHPLYSSARRRRRAFASMEEMLARYRAAPILARMDDEGLRDYVEALARPRPGGGVELAWSPEWEARIYLVGPLRVWSRLSELRPPLLVLRASESNAYWPGSVGALRRRLPSAQLIEVPDSSHLLPLERPREVATMIMEFLGQRVPAADLPR
jgi:pimeloyl-ACP methyl ester carboxylesterase